MDKAIESLKLSEEESDTLSGVTVHSHIPHTELSFYQEFALRGIQLDRAEPGFAVCSFKVPPRLTDRTGNLSPGAIANLVDEIGGCSIYRPEDPMFPTVNMSITYISTAKVDDVLEMTSRLVGVNGTLLALGVVIKNKKTGKVIAEGRSSLFRKLSSKI